MIFPCFADNSYGIYTMLFLYNSRFSTYVAALPAGFSIRFEVGGATVKSRWQICDIFNQKFSNFCRQHSEVDGEIAGS